MSTIKEPVLTLHGDYLRGSVELIGNLVGRWPVEQQDLDGLLTQIWQDARQAVPNGVPASVTVFADGSFRVNYEPAPAPRPVESSEPAPPRTGLEEMARFLDGRGPRPRTIADFVALPVTSRMPVKAKRGA